MSVVFYEGSRADFRDLLSSLGGMLSGKIPDPSGQVQALMMRVGITLLSEVQRDFITKARGGTGRDGIKWEPLKPQTVHRRRGHGVGGVEILRDTGELFRSLEPGLGTQPSGASGQVFELEPGAVTIGTNKKPWHHRGNERLPARPLWPEDNEPLPDEWWESMMDAFTSGVAELAVHHGRYGARH